MKANLKSVPAFLMFLFCTSLLPAASSTERYDELLSLSIQHSVASEVPKKWVLTFEHEKLPVLDGNWVMKKNFVKRIPTLLIKDVTHVHCNSRLPFEGRAFEKEVVISPQGEDFFVFRSLYPASKDTFLNFDKTKTTEYQNYSFKGVIIPGEITYAYTLKLINHLENPANARQLWFKGKLFFDDVSQNKISGKGYEIEYTPECLGFVRDEIEFELVKTVSLLPSSMPLQEFEF